RRRRHPGCSRDWSSAVCAAAGAGAGAGGVGVLRHLARVSDAVVAADGGGLLPGGEAAAEVGEDDGVGRVAPARVPLGGEACVEVGVGAHRSSRGLARSPFPEGAGTDIPNGGSRVGDATRGNPPLGGVQGRLLRTYRPGSPRTARSRPAASRSRTTPVAMGRGGGGSPPGPERGSPRRTRGTAPVVSRTAP